MGTRYPWNISSFTSIRRDWEKKMMTVEQRNLAILEYAKLPRICNDLERIERKFLIECRKDNIDEYLLRTYFTHLLMLTDELKDSYKQVLEQII